MAEFRFASHASCRALSGLAQSLSAALTRDGRGARLLRPGEVLYEVGDPTDALFAVLRGTVRESALSATGRELVLASAGPGETIGELCFCAIRARPGRAVARTEALVVPIRAEDLVAYTLGSEDQAIAVLEHFAHQLAERTGRLEALAFHDARRRLVDFLLLQAEAGHPRKDGGVEIPPLTHEELGGHIFATREQVSATLAGLRRRGAVAYGRGHPFVVYPERLREEAALEAR